MALTIPQGLKVANNNPLDNRTVFATLELAKASVNTSRRYRGLKIFITEEKKEYWFRDGVTNSDLIPYRPGAALYCVTSLAERNSIPLDLRFEGMEINLLLGGNVTKYTLIGGITDAHWRITQSSVPSGVQWEVQE